MDEAKVSKRGGSRDGAGRPVGAYSRTTKEARAAISTFVEGNLPKLQGWLSQVAAGLVKVDSNGEPVLDAQDSVVFVIKPDPAQAIKLVADICEYHLPKLSRAEVSSVNVSANLGTLTVEQLRVMRAELLEGRSVDSATAEIDITPVQEIPAWITK